MGEAPGLHLESGVARISRGFLLAGALAGASGVLLGAFGAHALSTRLSVSQLDTWDTAVLYQLVHAVMLVGVGAVARFVITDAPTARVPSSLLVAGAGFSIGILLFCGSLYLLALGGPRFLGPITPLGGVGFVAGWCALVVWAWR